MTSGTKWLAALGVFAIASWALFLAEPIKMFEHKYPQATTYRRYSVLAAAWQMLNVHESLGTDVLEVGGSRWLSPAWGGPPPYWRDPADGAMLFSTWWRGSPVADVCLVMPDGGPRYHARVNYSELVHFGGGDLGEGQSRIHVTRLSKTSFRLSQGDDELSEVVELK